MFRVGSAVTAGDSASTTRVITRPAGAALNDILVLRFYVEDQTLTPSLSPGSWTKITASSGEVGGGTPFEVHDYWSRQGAESGSITISWGGASVWNTAIAGAWNGRVTSGDPLDATSTFNSGNGTTATANGVTAANSESDTIAFASNGIGSAWAWAAGLTERADFGGQSFAENFQTQPGASGSKTATLSTGDWGASLIALRAADQPAPPSYPDASIWRRQTTGRLDSSALVRERAVDASALIAAEVFEAPSTSDITLGLTGVAATGLIGAFGLALVLGLSGVAGTGAVGTVTASSGSPDVTVGLTGVAAAGSAGSVGKASSTGLTGNTATGAVGSVVVARATALTGNAATGAVGTIATSRTLAPTGVVGTGSPGSLSFATSKSLTGNSATGSVGTLSHSRTSALIGVSGTGSAGTLTVESGAVADPVEVIFTVHILRQRSLTAAIATTAIRTMAVSKMATTATRLSRSDVRLAHITKQVRITEQR